MEICSFFSFLVSTQIDNLFSWQQQQNIHIRTSLLSQKEVKLSFFVWWTWIVVFHKQPRLTKFISIKHVFQGTVTGCLNEFIMFMNC
jgi:hypothetical protein